MTTRRLEGWLFDIDELGPEVALWVYTNEGYPVRLTEQFRQPVYVEGERARLRRLAYELDRRGIVSGVRWVERREFWSGKTIEVLELAVSDSSLMPKLRRFAASRDREFTFYNCDIPAAQYYLYLKRLFPLCKLSCEMDGAGNLLDVAAMDSISDAAYELPALRTLKMRGEHVRPPSGRSRIILECEGEQTSLRLEDSASAIESLNSLISHHDPDIILSERGDSVLMPALLRVAKRAKIDLLLDRDRVITKRKIVTEGRTYFSYGRVIYKGPSYPLFGRWHIDAKDSFIYHETGLDGLIELARLAKVPVQRMARTSPGSAMSSMQIDCAVSDGVLVPWRKSEPERYKTALELLTVDKGGLVFQPPVGAFERVAEIDFASMYPAIMARHNISPETVLCSCCENSVVPEADYNVCEKRRGLIPRTLEPLLERRKHYKRLMRESGGEDRERYDSRQTAIKWMLVSCFGYLGYRNARFGRIEAHEAVTAFGREKLLRAKEIAESAGFKVLHAITDSLWIKREGVDESDVLDLCEQITRECEVEMSLEGIYSWIVFLPSKEKETRPVPARYYGVFSDGRMKLRGLACRRDDTPEFVRETQIEMLAIVRKARTLAERDQAIEEAGRLLAERIAQLERGEVDPGKLDIRRTVTKEVENYKVETRTATAARQLRRAGIRVHPGERVRYRILDSRSKDKNLRVRASEINDSEAYEVAEYIKILKEAGSEVTG
ncbi:MAG TPA: DNA polymerase domain-containing protein [Blastocatellia bacterium]|nr:DNA polymerase domain-containing protein [Blastocatellia bacterium]